jgi:hypothetical protein
MYIAFVAITTVILPLFSIALDHILRPEESIIPLVGRCPVLQSVRPRPRGC